MDDNSCPELRDVISASWDMQTRIIRNLQREGIRTTKDLVGLTLTRVSVIRGIGPGSLQAIQEGLLNHGLSLTKETDPTKG